MRDWGFRVFCWGRLEVAPGRKGNTSSSDCTGQDQKETRSLRRKRSNREASPKYTWAIGKGVPFDLTFMKVLLLIPWAYKKADSAAAGWACAGTASALCAGPNPGTDACARWLFCVICRRVISKFLHVKLICVGAIGASRTSALIRSVSLPFIWCLRAP